MINLTLQCFSAVPHAKHLRVQRFVFDTNTSWFYFQYGSLLW